MTTTSRLVGVAIAGLALLSADNRATALEIEHEVVPCALVGEHPVIAARIGPGARVSEARVVFHAGDAGRWYAVAMHREGVAWVASLPRPRIEGTSFAYFIEVSGSDARGRTPDTSAYMVEVSADCPGPHLATTAHGPAELQVPPGAALVPEGFERAGIGAFVERVSEGPPPTAVRAAPLWTSRLAPLTRVRIQTVPPPRRRRGDVRETPTWVTVEDPAGGRAVFSREGEAIEGRIDQFEEDALILTVGDGEKVRVRAEHITRLDVREQGSAAMGIVGGLAGAAAGLLGTALVCASAQVCDDIWPLWIGTALGTAVGAAAGASPEWRSVTLARQDAFSLQLRPTRTGASLNAAVEF
jgi:hypothetical protein